MSTAPLQPLAAFDIGPDGTTSPVAAPWPDATPGPGAAWRWLHFALTDPALVDWTEAHLPVVAAAAIVQTETRPRCTSLEGGLVVNMRGVNLNPGAEPEDMVSLRLWVGPGLVVSVRRSKVFALDDLRRAAESGTAPASPGAFLAEIAEGLTDRLEAVSVELEDQTDALEEAILEREEDDAADGLASLRRKAIRLRRHAGPQREALVRLSEGSSGPGLIDAEARILLGESANRAARTVEELDAVTARLVALHDHLEGQRGTAMARNGYVLSVVAAIFLPLGFLTGLFGVNVAGMPGTASPWAFALLSAANVALALGLLALFRLLRWL
ncbi:zinc transporter ZntB [Rhodovulum sulfidophilum]|uniref:zinc transporter ZntB n=1 Tax=Rhodovulum sulfidophilum TaxID=35806 RepID=UPI001921FF29|nr:zinc transporter ZntB [Rhodovulum sulfidophilum]MBL3572666.1 zinc transporter ZntB [Rhodovulum sulfidophilum]MCE8432549.1 zinc transporter ZntB [Rhodovulum sulfidophilum]MCF4117224.1 zinc transporter ZntB [Rhodovulum sulfidophilum]